VGLAASFQSPQRLSLRGWRVRASFKTPSYMASPAAADHAALLRQTTPLILSRMSSDVVRVALHPWVVRLQRRCRRPTSAPPWRCFPAAAVSSNSSLPPPIRTRCSSKQKAKAIMLVSPQLRWLQCYSLYVGLKCCSPHRKHAL
jgi:hypothetical protein